MKICAIIPTYNNDKTITNNFIKMETLAMNQKVRVMCSDPHQEGGGKETFRMGGGYCQEHF